MAQGGATHPHKRPRAMISRRHVIAATAAAPLMLDTRAFAPDKKTLQVFTDGHTNISNW